MNIFINLYFLKKVKYLLIGIKWIVKSGKSKYLIKIQKKRNSKYWNLIKKIEILQYFNIMPLLMKLTLLCSMFKFKIMMLIIISKSIP